MYHSRGFGRKVSDDRLKRDLQSPKDMYQQSKDEYYRDDKQRSRDSSHSPSRERERSYRTKSPNRESPQYSRHSQPKSYYKSNRSSKGEGNDERRIPSQPKERMRPEPEGMAPAPLTDSHRDPQSYGHSKSLDKHDTGYYGQNMSQSKEQMSQQSQRSQSSGAFRDSYTPELLPKIIEFEINESASYLNRDEPVLKKDATRANEWSDDEDDITFLKKQMQRRKVYSPSPERDFGNNKYDGPDYSNSYGPNKSAFISGKPIFANPTPREPPPKPFPVKPDIELSPKKVEIDSAAASFGINTKAEMASYLSRKEPDLNTIGSADPLGLSEKNNAKTYLEHRIAKYKEQGKDPNELLQDYENKLFNKTLPPEMHKEVANTYLRYKIEIAKDKGLTEEDVLQEYDEKIKLKESNSEAAHLIKVFGIGTPLEEHSSVPSSAPKPLTAPGTSLNKFKIPNKIEVIQALSGEEMTELESERERLKEQLTNLEMLYDKICNREGDMMRNKPGGVTSVRDPHLVELFKLKTDIKNRLETVRSAFFDIDKKYRVCFGKGFDPSNSNDKNFETEITRNVEETPVNNTVRSTNDGDDDDDVCGAFDYFDPGQHWCRNCDQLFPKTDDYLHHIHTNDHWKKMDQNSKDDKPWTKPKKQQKQTLANPILTAVRGVQLIVPVKAYFCLLCKTFIGDSTQGMDHLKTIKHNREYGAFIMKNSDYEHKLATDKVKALERQRLSDKKRKRDTEKEEREKEMIKKRKIEEENRKKEKEKEKNEIKESKKIKYTPSMDFLKFKKEKEEKMEKSEVINKVQNEKEKNRNRHKEKDKDKHRKRKPSSSSESSSSLSVSSFNVRVKPKIDYQTLMKDKKLKMETRITLKRIDRKMAKKYNLRELIKIMDENNSKSEEKDILKIEFNDDEGINNNNDLKNSINDILANIGDDDDDSNAKNYEKSEVTNILIKKGKINDDSESEESHLVIDTSAHINDDINVMTESVEKPKEPDVEPNVVTDICYENSNSNDQIDANDTNFNIELTEKNEFENPKHVLNDISLSESVTETELPFSTVHLSDLQDPVLLSSEIQILFESPLHND